MTRTYYIKHNVLGETKFDKITFRHPDERPVHHRVLALLAWKEKHKGYGCLRVNSVYTKQEMKMFGYM